MRARTSWATLVALLLATLSVAATLSVIDYPLGAAWDEAVKLRGVSIGRYRYYHPLFMIDLAQAVALVVQPPDLQALAQLIRILAALAGDILVFATFGLARLVVPDLPALAAAAAMAATPLFTADARIFKEDIFVAAFLVLAFAVLIRLLQEPAPHRAILLVGFAAGSKYVGAVILPFAVLAILLVPTPGAERRLLRAGTVAAVAAGTCRRSGASNAGGSACISNIGIPSKATTCRCRCSLPGACSISAKACGPESARRCLFSA